MLLKHIPVIIAASLCSVCSFSQTSNNALNFDGTNDFVDLNVVQSAVFANKSHFTIELWMRGLTSDQTSSIRTVLFAINEPTGENRLLIVMGGPSAQDGKLMIYTQTGIAYTSTTEIGDGNCHHIAYSYNGTQGSVYIDGALVNTHNATYNITSTDRYSLGQEYDGALTSQFYKGDLDEVRIWGTTRTTAEIQANMNASLTGSEAGLLAYYNFNQGIPGGSNPSVNFLNDLTASGYDGTLNGFALSGSASNWVLRTCVSNDYNVLNFDGMNDFVNLNALQSAVFANKTHFTIEFWMRALKADQSDIRTVLFAINEPTAENRLLLVMGGPSAQDGKLMIYTDGSGGTGTVYTSTVEIGNGKCHHIAYSYDEATSTGSVYIDGTLVNTHTATYGITATDRYSLGQEYDAALTSQFYKGDLDELRIWGSVRTLSQIQSNMHHELTGTETGLLAYYNFNQGIPAGANATVNFLNDLTVSNLDGALNGFALNGSASNWVPSQCPETLNQLTARSMTEAEAADIFVYPNPTSEKCRITSEVLTSATIQVYNLLNEQVEQLDVLQFPATLDLGNQPVGVYFIKVSSDQGEFVKRVVVQ